MTMQGMTNMKPLNRVHYNNFGPFTITCLDATTFGPFWCVEANDTAVFHITVIVPPGLTITLTRIDDDGSEVVASVNNADTTDKQEYLVFSE